MISLSRTLGQVVPGLLVGVLALAAVPSVDAHPRHHGQGRHHARRVERVVVERVPVYVAPPYRPARVVYHGTPFLYQADLGVYVSGVSLGIHLGNAVPAGYVYEDPWCGAQFHSVGAYRRHTRQHGHPAYLSLVRRGGSCNTN
jgi:hypothetical protein